MAFIKYDSPQIGDWVTTTKVHDSFVGEFTIGSRVQITDIDPVRGYEIQDEFGNKICEIGWEI